MVHLALIGLIGVVFIVWLIQIRAWELSVTVELPAVKKAQEDVDEPEMKTEPEPITPKVR